MIFYFSLITSHYFEGKTDSKKRGRRPVDGNDLEFYEEEHISINKEANDINGVHNDNADFYGFTNPNERRLDKHSKNKKTGKLIEGEDIPLLSEIEKKELVALVKDKNISMDFILEMKEAFLLFDKVRYKNDGML